MLNIRVNSNNIPLFLVDKFHIIRIINNFALDEQAAKTYRKYSGE